MRPQGKIDEATAPIVDWPWPSAPGDLNNRAAAGTANRWWVLAVVSIGTLSSTLEGGIVVTVFPALARAFDTDSSTVLWVTVVYWVTAVGLLMTLGWLGDVAGRRRVFAWGMGIFALGMLLSAVSSSIWELLLWRVIQGIGSAMVLANVNALITEHFPARERGKALGVSGAVVGFGLTAGPFAGGFLIDLLDWRAVFYSRVPIAVLGALLAWWVLPDDRTHGERPHVDPIGATALFGAMGSLLLIVNQGGKLGFTSTPVFIRRSGGRAVPAGAGLVGAPLAAAHPGGEAVHQQAVHIRPAGAAASLPLPGRDTARRALLHARFPGLLGHQDGHIHCRLLGDPGPFSRHWPVGSPTGTAPSRSSCSATPWPRGRSSGSARWALG